MKKRFGLPLLRVGKCLFIGLPLLLGLPLFAQDNREACESPLLRAIYKRDFPSTQKLIDSRTDIDFRGCELGMTPLVESIAANLPDVAKALIIAGADPSLATLQEGISPLMAAAWYCREELVSLLLQRGAAVNAKNKEGETALFSAADRCHDGRIVSKLLASAAEVNLRAKYGDTPLTLAAFSGNETAVRLLVAAGADISATNVDGETALQIARDRRIGRKESHDKVYSFLHGMTKGKSRKN